MIHFEHGEEMETNELADDLRERVEAIATSCERWSTPDSIGGALWAAARMDTFRQVAADLRAALNATKPDVPELKAESRCSAEVTRGDEGQLVLTLDYHEGAHPAEKAWTALRAIVFTEAAVQAVEGHESTTANLDEVKWTGEDADAEPWWRLAVKAYRFGREPDAPTRPPEVTP
jgi:hypothetical protein